MINYTIIYILLILTSLIFIWLVTTMISRYLKNKADFRVVNIIQYVFLAGFLILETFHYLHTGEANQMCILLARNYLVFSLSAHLNCKLIGYKNIYSNKGKRNMLGVISNTLVYFCITCICTSYLKVNVVETAPNSLGRLLQISTFMESKNYYPEIMSYVPIIYCIFTYVSIVSMDFVERRNIITKLSGIFEIVPLAILIYDVTPISGFVNAYIRIILNTLYFSIPACSMINESINVIYFSKEKKDDTKEMIDKAFKDNRNKITNAGKVQAKIIAKEIQKDEDLLWLFPKGKKNENYKKYILDLLEDPE